MKPGFVARIGALVLAPRALARRDLDAQDGKGGDDLVLLAAIALVLDGAASLVRGIRALVAHRTNGALHAFGAVLQPAAPLFAAWIVTTLVLLAFTYKQPRRAAGELGARVTAALVVVSLVVAPFVGRLDPGALRYTLESLPWLAAALVFGAVLREAIDAREPIDTREPHSVMWTKLFGAGAALVVAIAASGVFLLGHALENAEHEPAPRGVGTAAPVVNAPLLGAGRLELATLRGRPVVLSFWATWCPPCLKELPVLEKLYEARGPSAPLLYAVNIDEPSPARDADVQAVRSRLGLTMPIAIDDGAAASAYGIQTIPTIVRVGAAGAIESIFDRPLDEPDLRDVMR